MIVVKTLGGRVTNALVIIFVVLFGYQASYVNWQHDAFVEASENDTRKSVSNGDTVVQEVEKKKDTQKIVSYGQFCTSSLAIVFDVQSCVLSEVCRSAGDIPNKDEIVEDASEIEQIGVNRAVETANFGEASLQTNVNGMEHEKL
ncbi:hypothetical protein Tco_1018553 [Tanacetum coccineum]|uniref:Uncharacterized protein n=1 Tax=Tanacetum coccineum TaxID=301880 RepID=A0ABQ5FW27_9ASTR